MVPTKERHVRSERGKGVPQAVSVVELVRCFGASSLDQWVAQSASLPVGGPQRARGRRDVPFHQELLVSSFRRGTGGEGTAFGGMASPRVGAPWQEVQAALVGILLFGST